MTPSHGPEPGAVDAVTYLPGAVAFVEGGGQGRQVRRPCWRFRSSLRRPSGPRQSSRHPSGPKRRRRSTRTGAVSADRSFRHPPRSTRTDRTDRATAQGEPRKTKEKRETKDIENDLPSYGARLRKNCKRRPDCTTRGGAIRSFDRRFRGNVGLARRSAGRVPRPAALREGHGARREEQEAAEVADRQQHGLARGTPRRRARPGVVSSTTNRRATSPRNSSTTNLRAA